MAWSHKIILSVALLVSFAIPAFAASSVGDLKKEHIQIQKKIETALKQHDQLVGGLIKSLIAMRLELLKTNAALVRQRIHALESGTKITITLVGTKANPQRTKQLTNEMRILRKRIASQKMESAKYSGGLIKAMVESGIATSRLSMAMLEMEYLKAKYGIHWLPSLKESRNKEKQPRETAGKGTRGRPQRVPKGSLAIARTEYILVPKLENKRIQKMDITNGVYQDAIWFDVTWDTSKLKRPTRAVKGVLVIADLFGESKLRIKWLINAPLKPHEKFTEYRVGFNYNQFMGKHQWMRSTELSDMTFRFEVKEIIYADGTREKY
jgi:hypothetical protein